MLMRRFRCGRARLVLTWLAYVGARPAEADNPLGCIVTGLEHGGTTVTSELIMTAPGCLLCGNQNFTARSC